MDITIQEAKETLNDLNEAVRCLILCPKDFGHLRHHGSNVFDPETQVANLKAGIMGVVWAVVVLASREVPEGTVVLQGSGGAFTEVTMLPE